MGERLMTIEKLRNHPFPEIETFSRNQLFEMIYFLEIENKTLNAKAIDQAQGKSSEQLCIENHRRELNDQLCNIYMNEAQKLNQEVKIKMSQLEGLNIQKAILENETKKLNQTVRDAESQFRKREEEIIKLCGKALKKNLMLKEQNLSEIVFELYKNTKSVLAGDNSPTHSQKDYK